MNDTKAGGLKWTVSGSGTLTNTSSTGATFNAPASVNAATSATVTAASVTDPTKSATVQITVNPPPAITTSSLTAATAGTAYNATVNSSGGTGPFTWSVSAGSLPPGVTLGSSTSASITLTGTPTGGNGSFTVKVVDAVGSSTTQALSLTVNAPPALAISTSSLPGGVIGTAYSQTLQATGGVPTYTWSVSSGSLPAGLTLNASTGVISGTPTGTFTGTTTFSITATDSQTPSHATNTVTLSISMTAPALSVTTASLPGGTLGTAYSQTLQATGGAGTYTWAAGALPAGLNLNTSTGVISGTPTGSTTGPVNFTVTVTDGETPTAKSAAKQLSITISAAPLSVVTTSLPSGVANSVYAGATLQAAGGVSPYSWAVSNGSLPAGLLLNTSTGGISGTPTTAGTANFTVTVTDSENPTAKTATANLSITINPPLSVTTSSLAAGVIGTAYNQTLQATGGITTYSWAVTVGSLPAGLTLNSGTGAITGTPTGPFVGTTNFTVTVTDSESPAKTATAALSITITAQALDITTTSLPAGVINTNYNATLTATGGVTPYIWTLQTGSNLPAGLNLASNGAITGTPTALGTTNFTVVLTDSETPTAASTTASLSITINNSAPVSVTTTSGQLPTGVVSAAYPTTNLTASGGTPPYTWAISSGTLPAGLTLNTSTGAISGTPTNSGTFNFQVKVTDSSSPKGSATANLSITVNPTLTITTNSLPNGSLNTAYAQSINSTGGIGPYTWSITSGNPPAGIMLGSSNGNSVNISGTPTASGTANFTVNVTDSETPAASASQNLSIDVTAQDCSHNSSLNGHYAFLLQGWTGAAAGEVFFGAAGSFVSDGGGNITSGSVDANDPSDGPATATSVTGTYCVAANNLGTMTLTIGAPINATSTFAFAIQSGGNGNIIFFDTGNIQASGQFFKQDTTAFSASSFSGPYAMGLVGADPVSSGGGRLAVAGRFTANGTADLSSGEVDTDDPAGPVNTTFTSTDFTVGASGRGTVALVLNGAGTLNFAFYVVNASQLLVVNIDPTATSHGVVAGQVVKQSSSSYTAAALNGVSVIELEDGTPGATVGLVTTNGVSAFSLDSEQNEGGTVAPLTFPTGTYTVSSNGRVTLTGAGHHPPVLYLTGNNAAFVVGTDSSVIFGLMEAQSGGPFTNSSLSGNYLGGSLQPPTFNVSEEVDLVQPSAGNVTVTGDNNSTQGTGAGNPTPDSFVGTYVVSSTGKTVVSQGGVQNGFLYIVSPSKFVFLDTTSNNPKLNIYQH